MLRRGLKVICLTSNWNDTECKAPVKGKLYTIRDIKVFPFGGYGLLFEEIKNEPKQYSDGIHEVYFWYRNFKPIAYNMDINYEILKAFKPVQEKSDMEITTPIKQRNDTKK